MDWEVGLMNKEESRVEREGRNKCLKDQGRYQRGEKQAKARPPGEEGMAVMGGVSAAHKPSLNHHHLGQVGGQVAFLKWGNYSQLNWIEED